MSYSKIRQEFKNIAEILRNVDCNILAILITELKDKSSELSQRQILEHLQEEDEITEKYLSSRLFELTKMGIIKRKRQNIAYFYWTSPNIIKNGLYKYISSIPILSSLNEENNLESNNSQLLKLVGNNYGKIVPCIEGFTKLSIVDNLKQISRPYDIFIFSLNDTPPPPNYAEAFFKIFKAKLLKGEMFRIRRIVSKEIFNQNSFYNSLYRNEINFIKKLIQKFDLNSLKQTKFVYEIKIMDYNRFEQFADINFRKPMNFFGVSLLEEEQGLIGYMTYSLREFLLKNQAHFIKSQYTYQFFLDIFENLWLLASPVLKDSLKASFNFIYRISNSKNGTQDCYDLMRFS